MVERPTPTLDVTITQSRDNIPVDLSRLTDMLVHAAVKLRIEGELGIWLCSDDEIAELHLRYMNIPDATDVITFPEDPPETGGYLGDVAVSADTAAQQAKEAGHSTGREIGYLCLHGLLHLAGYDDLDEDARAEMLLRQDELLHQFEREFPGEWSGNVD